MQEVFLMKYLTMSQNFYQPKFPFFHVFRGWLEFNFPERQIYANEAALLIFDIFY